MKSHLSLCLLASSWHLNFHFLSIPLVLQFLENVRQTLELINHVEITRVTPVFLGMPMSANVTNLLNSDFVIPSAPSHHLLRLMAWQNKSQDKPENTRKALPKVCHSRFLLKKIMSSIYLRHRFFFFFGEGEWRNYSCLTIILSEHAYPKTPVVQSFTQYRISHSSTTSAYTYF